MMRSLPHWALDAQRRCVMIARWRLCASYWMTLVSLYPYSAPSFRPASGQNEREKPKTLSRPDFSLCGFMPYDYPCLMTDEGAASNAPPQSLIQDFVPSCNKLFSSDVFATLCSLLGYTIFRYCFNKLCSKIFMPHYYIQLSRKKSANYFQKCSCHHHSPTNICVRRRRKSEKFFRLFAIAEPLL